MNTFPVRCKSNKGSLRNQFTYTLKNPVKFKEQLLAFSRQEEHMCILDSCGFQDKRYEYLAAVGIIEKFELNTSDASFDYLKKWNKTYDDWKFGFISYELKNQFENLSSSNPDAIDFGLGTFIIPRFVIAITEQQLTIHYGSVDAEKDVENWLNDVLQLDFVPQEKADLLLKESMSRKDYIEKVEQILHHIQVGDIYEMNFCQEFSSSQCKVNPEAIFSRLTKLSPAPQSTFLKLNDRYLMSASPERYLFKEASSVLSQPMKGTIRRSADERQDQQLKEELLGSQKERSENVMIVDLVRNDLSRIAKKGSVQVDELFGLYTFPHVHQLISTISATLDQDKDILDVVEMSFPMGSMTGAPKIRAMKLIEAFELRSRGIFSGSVGYIDPNGDADFNVVIRSLMYNRTAKYLSFQVGGAITALSDPQSEYEECMLKAKALIDVVTNAQT